MDAATERVEHDLDRQLMTATFRQDQFCWNEDNNADGEIRLHKKGVQTVSAVEYVDADGASQTLDPSLYRFDAGRGSLFVAPGETWPTVQSGDNLAVQVTFTAGYGVAGSTIPRLFKQAILLCIGKWFYDPAQEGSALHSQEVAYNRIVNLLMRSSY